MRIKNILTVTLCVAMMATVHAQFPKFSMTRADATHYGSEDVPGNVPVLYMYFSPTCPDCQQMTTYLLDHSDELQKEHVKVVMLTNKLMIDLQTFITRFNVDDYPFITAGCEDAPMTFPERFHITLLPFLVLFDKNGNQLLKFDSTTPEKDFIPKVISTLKSK